jgi:ABC-2 type transport system permease protein
VTAAAGLPARQPSARWLRIRAIGVRHWWVLLRSPHRLFDVVLWPVVDVVLFGSIGAFVQGGGSLGRQAAGYLLAGIVLWHVVYQSQISVSTGVLEETWSRQVLNLMTTPMSEGEYAAGVALFGMLKTVVAVGAVALCALTLFGFGITSLGWVLVPVVAVLLLSGWVIALFVIGVVLRFGSGAEALAWGVLFAVMPLSGVFYPVRSLPAVFRPIALVLPTTHALAAGRAAVDGHGVAWGQLGLAAATALGCGVAATFFVRHQLAVFRARGYVTRYS